MKRKLMWALATPMTVTSIAGAGCALLDTYDFNGYVLDAGCSGSLVDARNCGTCGHDCLGGSCIEGACQPWAIASGAEPFSVAVRGDTVYWTNNLERGSVYETKVDGGDSRVFAPSNLPFDVVTNDNYVYWTAGLDGGSLQRCPMTGCADPPELLYRGPFYPFGVAFTDAAAYWTVNPWDGELDSALPDAPGAVWRETQSATGGDPLVGGQLYPNGIATDDEFLYWADEGPGAAGDGAILRAHLDGTNVVTLASSQASPITVVVYRGQVYWTNLGLGTEDGSVMTCAPSACEPSAIANDQAEPYGLGVDESGVYWTNSGGTTVARCEPVGPACKPRTIAGGQDGPLELALDSVSIYWTTAGSVMRLAK